MNNKTIQATGIHGEKTEVEISSLELSVRVYGIAVDGDKALISPQFDGYDWPGGTMELGETHIETLKREYKEETGMDIEPIKPLNIYSSFFHKEKSFQTVLIFYLVNITGGEISTDGFDDDEKEYASKAEWKTLEELENTRHACSIDIAKDLIVYAREAMKNQ
jgi:ADP-ribose pyrophosphatase YjhB (NUDIX family)